MNNQPDQKIFLDTLLVCDRAYRCVSMCPHASPHVATRACPKNKKNSYFCLHNTCVSATIVVVHHEQPIQVRR